MDFRLLGPVELWVADRRQALGSARGRCLLAILAHTPGQLVSGDALVDRLWDDDPPPSARATFHTYVSRLRGYLRRAVGDEASLAQRGGGYALEVDPEAVDLQRFRRLRAQARAMADSGEDADAAQLLRAAEGLSRGVPMADLTVNWAVRQRGALEQEQQATTLDRIEVDLRLRRHADLVGELFELVGRFPFHEAAVEHLMVALYRCGRQAEAMEVYRDARERISDEIGSEPTPHLRDVHQRILRGNLPPAPPPTRGRTPRRAPNNLPRDIPEFTGRADEMRWLVDVLTSRPRGVAVPVVAIHGMPGIGKTALAVHVAHQLADQYPDALLYLDLRGHHPIEPTLDAGDGLDVLLRSLEVPARSMPPTVDDRAALWRTKLAGRRALLVLDDAVNAEQVNPMLPASPECLVLITSRQVLTGLGGISSLSLDVLTPDDGAALLRHLAGADRTGDAGAVEEVVRLCGRLPLALRLVGGKLRERLTWSAGDLADRLAREPSRPGRTRLDDSVIAEAFELSYQDLTPGQQRALRRLGLHPATNFRAYEAAALAGVTPAEAERLLDGLYEHHLVEEFAHGRFRLHDLLRDYARDLALRDDSEPQQRLAVERLLDYHLDTADRADRVLNPHRHRIDVHIEHPPTDPPPMRGHRDARGWLAAERPNLLQAARYAADNGWPERAALLAHVLAGFLDTAGYWGEAAAAHERAVALWRDLGDRPGEAHALLELSAMLWRTGQYDDALQYADEALIICRAVGDRRGEAEALDRTGLVHWHTGRYPEFLEHCHRALRIFREVGDQHGEAGAVNHRGIASWHHGRYDDALADFRLAAGAHREIRGWYGEREALNNLGDALLRRGRHQEALDYYERSLEIVREIGGRQHEAVLTGNLGVLYTHTGDPRRGLDYGRRALDMYRELGDRRDAADELNHIGAAYQGLGMIGEALIHHQKSLAVAREIADPFIQAQAFRNIGDVHLEQERYSPALIHLAVAVDLARRIGDPYEEARALDSIGRVVLRIRGQAEAEQHWRRALKLYTDVGVPEADEVKARLSQPRTTGS